MDTNGVLSMYTIFYTIENGPERNIMVPFNGQNVSYISCFSIAIMFIYIYACM